MATDNFFFILAGIKLLLEEGTGHRVEDHTKEYNAEHASLALRTSLKKYRVELNHNFSTGRSSLKIRFYSEITGSRLYLKPYLVQINGIDDQVKWIHFGGNICSEKILCFNDGVTRHSLEAICAYILRAANAADQVTAR